MTQTSYYLAVDVGTSRTAASVARISAVGELTASGFALGRNGDSAPSAIFAGDDDLLFGEAAQRRGLAQPERLIREFKRRVGDDVPIVAGDHRYAPEYLYARVVAWVVDTVAEREGCRPAAISVAIPVTWGGYRAGQVSAAIAREVSADVELIAGPVAAALHYESTTPLAVGSALAVYDLGGGTFDVVILTKTADGSVRVIGEPAGLGDFGGVDFDDAVLAHTVAAAELSTAALTADAGARVALATLRRECVEAKEALSFDSEAVIPVLVGQTNSTVRLTRTEFEDMIDEGIDRTIDVLASALEVAEVEVSDVQAILLTGGSSRIPRVSQLLSEHFDRPIAIDADPKAIVALGAARALADGRRAQKDRQADSDAALAPASVIGAVALGDAVAARRDELAPRRRFGRLPIAIVGASAVLLLTAGSLVFAATELDRGAISAVASSQTISEFLGVKLTNDETPVTDTAPLAETVAAPPAGTPPTASTPPPATLTRPYSNPRRPVAERTPQAPRSIGAPRPTTPAPFVSPFGAPNSPPPAQTPSIASNPPAADPTPNDPEPSDPPSDPPADPPPTVTDPPEPSPSPSPDEPV